MSSAEPPRHYSTPHADEQLFDRYGVIANRSVWRSAFLDVVDRRSLLLSRSSNGRERHIVRVDGVAVMVVYSPQHAKFNTALPPNSWSY
jgi:hypothetical protein